MRHTRYATDKAHERIAEDLHRNHVEADALSRKHVAADGENAASHFGVPEQEIRQRHNQYQRNHLNRQTDRRAVSLGKDLEERRQTEVDKRLRNIVDISALGQKDHQTACNRIHAQRRNERRQLEIGDKQTVHCSEQGADEHAQHIGQHRVGRNMH